MHRTVFLKDGYDIMKNKILKICLILIAMLMISATVGAHVPTSHKPDRRDSVVLIAGNPDFYPIEYYNEKTHQFDGVIPAVLTDISQKLGIEISYLYDGKTTQTEFANSLRADLVSAYIIGSSEMYAADEVKVLSVNYEGKKVDIGIAFTEAADSETVENMKNELAKLSVEEMNMYLLKSADEYSNSSFSSKTVVIICVSFLIALLILIIAVSRVARKKYMKIKLTDTETALGNIEYFENQYERMISAYVENKYIAYIIIDSNYLQIYHGESVFIDAIKYTAGILSTYEHENGFAGKITENGFAYVFESENHEAAGEIIRGITDELNLYIHNESKNDMPFFHTAVYNIGSDDRNCELVLFNLRKHCNKLMGTPNQIITVDSEMMNRALNEKYLYESIVSGFENKEFKLYLQFVVDSADKKIVSAEALSRWENPERGTVSPGAYIALMEKSGLITTFDYYMFELACRQLHKWRDTEFENVTLSCNFTRITISEDNFADMISSISKKYVFEKNKLIMEITEDAIEKNHDVAMENISKCKKMGFKIALDDLGSGYTSLVNLCEYPIDIVKIDRDILLRAEKENGKDLFVGIIALSHSLGFKVVCEGVETEEHRELVDSTECDYIQGWYYSRVYPVDVAEQYAREYAAKIL